MNAGAEGSIVAFESKRVLAFPARENGGDVVLKLALQEPVPSDALGPA